MLLNVRKIAFPCLLAAAPALANMPVSYEQQIRPILSGKCLQCHGPDEESRKGGLRLDVAMGETDTVIVPGKPDESMLLQRILSADPGERMPPPEVAEALTTGEIALLRQWISEGAERTEHWARHWLDARLTGVEPARVVRDIIT